MGNGCTTTKTLQNKALLWRLANDAKHVSLGAGGDTALEMLYERPICAMLKQENHMLSIANGIQVLHGENMQNHRSFLFRARS